MLYDQLQQYIKQSGLSNYRYFFSETDFGSGIDDSLGLVRKGAEWQILYCDRGSLRKVKTYISEHAACRAYLLKLADGDKVIRSTQDQWPEALKAG